ncbi:uncharacterized protein SEPMUDRAFT_149145 [Sphaerulina musiva SO2202]|uniref:N-acetyltransferase domain-containing protein n=1 Tax=Sphaerulina musiva (strain SO2202) TaxID=692275 RepID=M3BWR9_SPHMS|nr:uncharacterized protein SEPMUDRAFT_149145 [Sphaerulina musiva SO2202]EMF12486.1 hypothetical protein SEPMUDRAFT_149145 [Sphaerulina musiva SO2202]
MQYTSSPPVTSLAQGRQWLSARAVGSEVFNFAIRERCSVSSSSSSSSSATEEKGEGGKGYEERVIGLVGSFHLPSCGYLLHPEFMRSGYATEALRGWVEWFWEDVAFSCSSSTSSALIGDSDEGRGGGWEFVEAHVDVENVRSMRVLEKTGFTRCEDLRDLEGREEVVWRLARPGGRTLEELGLLNGVQDEPPVPPVQ